MHTWDKPAADRFMAEWRDISAAYAALFDADTPADAQETLDVTDRHYHWICQSWTPDRESYTGLGRLYVDSPDFKSQFDHAEGFAEYVSDAIAAYASARL